MKKKLTGIPLSALVLAIQAAAQVVVAQPVQVAETITITGTAVARSNVVVDRTRIDAMPAAQNIIDSIKLVPGVSIRGADATNADPWSYGINIRGFDVNLRSSKIGQTIDDLPAYNASYYLGGAPAQKYMLLGKGWHYQE